MGPRLLRASACLTAVVLLAGCRGESRTVIIDNRIASVQAADAPAAVLQPFQLTSIAEGLPAPTALAALSQGGFLVASRDGGLVQVDAGGTVTPLAGTPATAEGGIFAIQPGPGFVANRRVYLAYPEPDPAGGVGLAVAWATLQPGALAQPKVLHRIPAASLGGPPQGAALAFDGRGHLFVGLDLDAGAAPQAAMPADLLLRLLTDGRIPRDNLWPAGSGVRPEGFSIGHGRIRALAIDPRTGLLWSAEDLGTAGSELNLPRFGQRFGPSDLQPLATGDSPAAAHLPERSAAHALHGAGQVRGLAVLAGQPGSPWAASLFVAGDGGLLRLPLEGVSRITGEEPLPLPGTEAPVDVAIGADRAVYLLTGGPQGRLLRLQPPALVAPAPDSQ